MIAVAIKKSLLRNSLGYVFIVSLSKSDLISEKEITKLSKTKIKKVKEPLLIFSAATGFGLKTLQDRLWETLNKA